MTSPLRQSDAETRTSRRIPVQCIPARSLLITLSNVSSVGIGAILGVLTRISINVLFGPEKANITSSDGVLFNDLPANVLGCLVMGIYNSLQSAWRFPKMLSLCIATGYAGSLTTFASWHVQVVQMMVAGNVLKAMLAIFVGVCMSVSLLTIGRDFGNLIVFGCTAFGRRLKAKICIDAVAPEGPEEREERNCMKCNSWGGVTTASIVALFTTLLVGVTAGTAVLRDRSGLSRFFLASAMFSPLGAVIRWRLSFLNTRRPRFPLGTYIANMLAMTLNFAILIAIEVSESVSSEALFFLTALMAGLGGSLSTVSTWISESLKLNPPWRYCYILTTITSAVLIGILSYGITVWVDTRQKLPI